VILAIFFHPYWVEVIRKVIPILIAFSFPFGCFATRTMSSSPKQFAVDVSRVHIVIITGVYAIVACILLSAIVFYLVKQFTSQIIYVNMC
jgi:hypothetical protein